MPSLRKEITKTFHRLSKWGGPRPSRRDTGETIARPDVREGHQLGAYRILKRLGSGGMGHVYLALDTRLGRHVALKFLSPELTADAAMLHRLEQEARTASALNHPNILTIYEIGELAGEHFIASEYVDGTTLRAAMDRGTIEPGIAIDIASQVASALMAAHAAGVVHRDLKPGNVMIRPDGLVKVIDFGLAKRMEKVDRGSSDPSWTGTGSMVGTVDYMSPEQARGDDIDHRTDLWSLGVLLYEMLANRRPFEGDTESHVVVAILDHPVPPLPEKAQEIAGLSRIVQRALIKDPAKRYQTAHDMLADLHSISHISRPGSSVRLAALTRPGSSRKWLVRVAAALLVLLLTGVALWRWASRGPDWFQVESVRQLTSNGRTKLAAISPDGAFLAFVVSEPDGMEALYLEDVRRPSEEIKLKPEKITYKGVTFSPDGRTIFVAAKDEKLMGRLYSVPLVGDPSKTLVLTDVDGPVSFAPNGNQFAFIRYIPGRETRLQIKGFDTPERTLLSVQGSLLQRWVAWSPNGREIAAFLRTYGSSDHKVSETMLDLIGTNQHQSELSLPGWRYTEQPWWTPGGNTLIVPVASYGQEKSQMQLKEVAVKSGDAHEVTTDLAGYSSPTMTQDGQQLAAVRMETRARLWISKPADLKNGQSSSAVAADYPSLAWYDSGHLIISSQRGGVLNLSSFDIATQTPASLTSEPNVEQGAAVVPGSKSVVFASTSGGGSHLWKFDPETNQYTQLTFGSAYDQSPAVSRDGKWIVYTSWTVNTSHLYKIPIAGGESIQIANYVAQDPELSPDGKFIACQAQETPSTSDWSVAVLPFDGKGPLRLVPNAHVPVRWSPDGNSLSSVLTDSAGVSNIWAIPMDGSPPRQLTHFDDETIFAFAWSPDGDRLACLRGTVTGEAVLFKRRHRR